jgi:hypothetical protein
MGFFREHQSRHHNPKNETPGFSGVSSVNVKYLWRITNEKSATYVK